MMCGRKVRAVEVSTRETATVRYGPDMPRPLADNACIATGRLRLLQDDERRA